MSLVIDKINLFLGSLLLVAMLLVVAVLILREAAGWANLNFFGRTYVTLRRLADPLTGPVRRHLLGMRLDPRFAPWITIAIVVFLWWVISRGLATVLGVIAVVLKDVQQQAMTRAIGDLLIGLLSIYILMIFLRIVFSWFMLSSANPFMRFLIRTTEPLLGTFRRLIPPVGMFDISALVAMILLALLQSFLERVFLR